MALESIIKNTIKVQKTFFNSIFNTGNLIAERVGTTITVNVPSQYRAYINNLRTYGSSLRVNYRKVINEGFDKAETIYVESLNKNIPQRQKSNS